MPMIFKPIFGKIIDSHALCGYRIKSYLILCSCFHILFIGLLSIFTYNVYVVILSSSLIVSAMAFEIVISEVIIVKIGNLYAEDKSMTEEDKENWEMMICDCAGY